MNAQKNTLLHFRGSVFESRTPLDLQYFIWHEVHRTADGQFVVAVLQGTLKNVGRPGAIKQFFFSREKNGVPVSLPSAARCVALVATIEEAQQKVYELELDAFAKYPSVLDVGILDKRYFGGVEHYIKLLGKRVLKVMVPFELFRKVDGHLVNYELHSAYFDDEDDSDVAFKITEELRLQYGQYSLPRFEEKALVGL